MQIALVAGEPSGDLLGADLITALKARYPQARFTGIGGPGMVAQGMQSQTSLDKLAVMGLVEVLRHLPELLDIRRQLCQRLITDRPDVFIGIDAPDFNLGLERQLRAHGIPTVHYVSPSVWAWRPWRVRKIARAVDLMLTLFPFEAAFYEQHGVPVRSVGHPLADAIPLRNDAGEARRKLGLSLSDKVRIVALLPGSRSGEIDRMGSLFLDTARWLYTQRSDVHFLTPAATPRLYAALERLRSECAPDLPLTLIQGHSREVMAAADVVLLASGTATLEAMLLKRPMVVAYRVAPATAWLARRLVTLRYFALPNLLAGRQLVPEFFQEAATAPHLGASVLNWLADSHGVEKLTREFETLHELLRRNASEQAAAAIAGLMHSKRRATFTG